MRRNRSRGVDAEGLVVPVREPRLAAREGERGRQAREGHRVDPDVVPAPRLADRVPEAASISVPPTVA